MESVPKQQGTDQTYCSKFAVDDVEVCEKLIGRTKYKDYLGSLMKVDI